MRFALRALPTVTTGPIVTTGILPPALGATG